MQYRWLAIAHSCSTSSASKPDGYRIGQPKAFCSKCQRAELHRQSLAGSTNPGRTGFMCMEPRFSFTLARDPMSNRSRVPARWVRWSQSPCATDTQTAQKTVAFVTSMSMYLALPRQLLQLGPWSVTISPRPVLNFVVFPFVPHGEEASRLQSTPLTYFAVPGILFF